MFKKFISNYSPQLHQESLIIKNMLNIFFQKIKNFKNPKAFTLVEAMVATVIIIIAISGPLAVAVAASGYVRDTKDNMTSIYLAQEAIDLLRYKRDSLTINCLNHYNESSCPTIDFETEYPTLLPLMTGSSSPKEAAWKIFKNQIGFGGVHANDDCHSSDGCYYDFIGFVGKTAVEDPVTYNYNSGCDYLYRKDDGDGSEKEDFVYMCTNGGLGYTKTSFSRKVFLERLSTSTNPYIQDYHDDIKVIVTVSYLRHNGLIKEAKLVDFLHSK